MKTALNDLYNRPVTPGLAAHLRDCTGLKDDDKKIFDSLVTFRMGSDFHYQNADLPPRYFESRLKAMNGILFSEILRLAEVGYKHEENMRKACQFNDDITPE